MDKPAGSQTAAPHACWLLKPPVKEDRGEGDGREREGECDLWPERLHLGDPDEDQAHDLQQERMDKVDRVAGATEK